MGTRGSNTTLTFDKHECFRQRIILAALTGKTIVVKNIRSRCENPGLRDYEIELLRMIEQVSNGSRIEINESGTQFQFTPGSLHGGAFEYSFSLSRPISYYLEVLFCIAPFTKHPVDAVLRGVTHYFDEKRSAAPSKRKRTKLGGKAQNEELSYVVYPSCDALAALSLPILRAFLGGDADRETSLEVRKRGVLPHGGGEVNFTCSTRAQLRAVRLVHEVVGDKPVRVRRIRGVAWTARVAPTASARLIDSARAVLNRCCADVYVTAQHCRGDKAGKSPGFGLLLVAEYTNSTTHHATERISLPRQVARADQGSDDEQEDRAAASEAEARRRELNVPERLGEACAVDLLHTIRCGGAVDRSQQTLALMLMAFTATELNKIETCTLTPCAIDTIRTVYAFTGLKYRVEPLAVPATKAGTNATSDDEDQEEEESEDEQAQDLLTVTCVGLDYGNLNRAIL